jgi:hypothetical protein
MEISFASLTEIQNARGIMDVLAEMLNAIEPSNKEVYLKCEEFRNYTCNNTIIK